MTTQIGILSVSAGFRASRDAVQLDLDTRVHRFLRDHLVDGRPLLPTVMGIETIACAVRHARPEARIASITDVRVGPPYLVPSDGRGTVVVTMSGGRTMSGEIAMSGDATLHCSVRSDAVQPHFTADVVLADSAPGPDDQPSGQRSPILPPVRVPGDTVYGLYFHGPSFRVIDTAGVDGATAVARLSRGLPAVVEPPRGSFTAPLLLELCLQTAGLWDLAAGHGMTIPRHIDRVRRFGDLDSGASAELFAVVDAGSDDAGPRFDARVVDAAGRVQLAVDGYRTTPFGHPYDATAADRIRAQLGPISARRASP